jgi:tetratricopeptide (TPR) repeat protein
MKSHSKAESKTLRAKNQQRKFPLSSQIQLAGIAVVIFILYSPALNKEFTNFDDQWYIYNNPLLINFGFGSILKMFTQFYEGQYSPVPLVLLGIVYRAAGSAPYLYNLFSILLHIAVTGMVCWLVFRLSKKQMTSLIVASLFGVCTINVETVAWASAAFKIELYSFFFLASLVSYTFFIETKQQKYFVMTIILFVFAFMCKEQAAALVLSLVAVDFLLGRKLFSREVILEKIPFILGAVTFGFFTLLATKSNSGELVYTHYSIWERILFACYAFAEYIVKLFVPYRFSLYYPFPDTKLFSAWFYVHPVIVGIMIFLFFASLKKNRAVSFGLLFFLCNLLFTLALQIVSVRGAVMADRYCYISSIGIFYAAAEGFGFLFSGKYKLIAMTAAGSLLIFSVYKTNERCLVWKDSLTVWNDVIEQYQNVPIAYNNRGLAMADKKNYSAAISDYTKAIKLKDDFIFAYSNLGTALTNLKRYNEAIDVFSEAIKRKPEFATLYFNRGLVYYEEKKFDDATHDYSKAIELKPDYAEAYFNRGLSEFYSGKNDAACEDFSKAIRLDYKAAKEAFRQACQ